VEQDAQTDVLYDFLYRDSGRIGSLYAQIFGGRLLSFEKGESARATGEQVGKLSVGVGALEGKSTKETLTSP
jgi:hypothetical protein